MLSVSQTTIDAHLDRLIPKEDRLPYTAARYSLFSGGKRFRPKLVLCLAGEKGLDAAAAIEFIHTYSLIHDDLPCMDDDAKRRGKPTLHKVVSEGQALLAGDYLQILAFDVIANSHMYTDRQKVDMIQVISSCCGSDGMIGGQATDLSQEALSEEQLLKMHGQKTGALMRASLVCGAIVAEMNPEPFAHCGDALGIAYQLYDDIADEETHMRPERCLELAQHYQQIALKWAGDHAELKTIIESIHAT